MKIKKKGKQLFAVLLSVAMIITTLPLGAITANAVTTQFAGGSGTQADPYLIETKEHLNNVRNELDAHYKLIDDIEFSATDFAVGGDFYNNGNGWEAIITTSGSYFWSFTGTFDGNGHYIEGLTIYGDSSNLGYIGLFGDVSGEVRDLEMRSVNISLKLSKRADVGCVSGSASSTAIKNCKTNGTIVIDTAPNYESVYVGGICGRTAWADIIDCQSDVKITCDGAFDRVGGICGAVQEGSISESVNYGELTGTHNIGGIAGDIVETEITSCANFGKLNGISFSEQLPGNSYASYDSEVGGIVAHTNSKDVIKDCFNAGELSADGTYGRVGGIVGYSNGLKISNCYNVGTISSAEKGGIIAYASGVTAKDCFYPAIEGGKTITGTSERSLSNLKNQSTYINFDFESIWEFAEGNYYKYPTIKGVDCFIVNENATFNGGNGTEASPYYIACASHLNNTRNYLSSHFKLVKNIEFLESDFEVNGKFYNNGTGWKPIGSGTTNKSFTGVFDGNGYSVKNIIINIQSEQTVFAGLFNTNSGTIKNLGIEDGHISIKYGSAGGVSGRNDNGIIENCFNTCDIKIEDETGSTTLGGIVGVVYSGTVKNCYNTGYIYSTDDAGGIAGTNSGLIQDCFNTGYIRAINGDDSYSYAGGIAGTNHNIIQSCYNVGYITSERAGGAISGLLVDLSNPDAKFINCYYLNNVSSGEEYGDEGAIKCTSEHLQSQTTFSGFDFVNVWRMPTGSDYTYPELITNSINFIQKVQGISIVSLPYKTEYYVGLEDFDISGAKIAEIYNDGTVEEIDVIPSMVSGYDKTKAGEQTITVTYNGGSLTFDVTNLSLVYDYKLTTDETITLEYEANKDFDFIISDETTAKITNVSSSTITWGSSIKKTSAATISPLKPGYVILRAIDKTGNVLSKSLLLIEEGKHQLELLETVKKPNCTETGHEIYKCKFCDYQEERFPDALGHTEVLDNRVEPTCTKTGLTDGKHCSVCEEVLVKQNIIEATGIHIWDKGKTDKNGNIYYECDTCEATYSKNLLSIKVTSKPTKLSYVEHDDMDFSGMVITAYYDNNTTAIISSNWSASYGMNAGTQTVTVEHCGKVDTFTISVKAKVPSAITSSKHTISGNNISKITAGTTVSSLLSGLNEGSYCKVYKGSSEVSGNTAVGTGMVVKIMDGNTVKTSYTVIVTGDTNGDGSISVTDMIAIKAHILNKSTLTGVYATAANTNGDSGISITDFIQVKAKILGKGSITAR